MSASTTQKSQFRGYFNDSAGAVFGDSEVDAIWDEAATYETDDLMIMMRARIIGIDRLRMDAAKLTSYKQNSSSESQSDIFKALSTMRAELVSELGMLGQDKQASVKIAGTRKYPKRTKAYPYS